MNRRRGRLDLAHIRGWLATFAEIKGDPELARPFEEALKATGAKREE